MRLVSRTRRLAVVLASCAALVIGVLSAPVVEAADLNVACGDVPGLAGAITSVNGAPGTNNIVVVGSCPFTLIAPNVTSPNGPDGLPVVTGNGAGSGAVALSSSRVAYNAPNHCRPVGSVPGCAG